MNRIGVVVKIFSLTSLLLAWNLIAATWIPISAVHAQDKINFASSVKQSPVFYLPILATEENGFWKRNGLEARWVPFRGAAALNQGVAAGSVQAGIQAGISLVLGNARGVPMIIVSDLQTKDLFALWVRAASPIKELKDMKGARIGVPRLGGSSDAYGVLMARSVGLEKDLKFIGVGGIRAIIAALKTGTIDATIEPVHLLMDQKLKGELREIAKVSDYLPKEWLAHAAFAHKKFARNQANTMRRILKALLQASNFLRQNPGWAIDKLKTKSGFSDRTAKEVLRSYNFTSDGKFDPKAIKNALNFIKEFGLAKKKKLPEPEEVYTLKFLE
jgi:ABC-type nitrate/sulfonate/bicarbonate transport system substrate-binding protein